MLNHDDLKVPELKVLAAKLGIDGAEGMKRAELIEALEKLSPAAAADPIHEVSPAAQMQADLAKHPKFSKFNSNGGN